MCLFSLMRFFDVIIGNPFFDVVKRLRWFLCFSPPLNKIRLKSNFKVHLFWEGHKVLRNLHLTFDNSTYSQKLVEDLAKFCGLLRIYELYSGSTLKKIWAGQDSIFVSCWEKKGENMTRPGFEPTTSRSEVDRAKRHSIGPLLEN